MATAYRKLGEDLAQTEAYLAEQGVGKEEIIAHQIETETIYRKNDKGNNTNDIEAYRLRQSVELRSKDVRKIARISREATSLINRGVEFYSGSPEYFYTKLDELKVEMLAKATENAKLRAENMVKATGNKINWRQEINDSLQQRLMPVNVPNDWSAGLSVDFSTPLKKLGLTFFFNFPLNFQ